MPQSDGVRAALATLKGARSVFVAPALAVRAQPMGDDPGYR
jgi:hypothetical protein